jgi:uncharacterized surface protein with fasciclin (FAS1) repeats
MMLVATTLAMLLATSIAAPAPTTQLDALHAAVETGGKQNHLWFNYVWAVGSGNSYSRCGEVDAAPRMPQALFMPQNFLELAAYAHLTTQLYQNFAMNSNTTLQLGRCSTRGYTSKQSSMDGIDWAPQSLMNPICEQQCNCSQPGTVGPYSYCKDMPDDPTMGKWCSLCGPKYNQYIKIQLYNKPGDDRSFPFPAKKNIVELAAATPDLSTFVTAVTTAGLVPTLSTSFPPFTVFAPSNEAFAKLPPLYLKLLLDPKNVHTLQRLLTFHVVSGAALYAKNLTNGQKIKTIEGNDVTATVSKKIFGSIVQINDASVIAADNAATNGVVHIIDQVLMPPDEPAPTPELNIVEFAVANPDLSTLVTAIKAAGLVDTLAGPGPFTVFAPSNEAFGALPFGVLANLLKPQNKEKLVKLLTYHVVAGAAIKVSDLQKGQTTSAASVEGSDIQAFRACTDRKCGKASRVFINPFQNVSDGNCGYQRYKSCYEAQVSSKDNIAANGVVHIVDSVLNIPNHLYFNTINGNDQCGQVDAAPRIPTALFEPINADKLKQYVAITIKYYSASLAVGQCKAIGYVKSAGTTYAGWTNDALMVPICKNQCNCNYPDCPDQPDDPSAGTWCSLCGPKFNNNIAVSLFSRG